MPVVVYSEERVLDQFCTLHNTNNKSCSTNGCSYIGGGKINSSREFWVHHCGSSYYHRSVKSLIDFLQESGTRAVNRP